MSSTHVERQEQGDLCSSGTPEEQLLTKPTKNPKPNKNEDHVKNGETCVTPTYRNGCKNSEKTLWMTGVPEHRDSYASSSHEPSLEPKPARSADLGKHSVYTHFPKERHCEICRRTKITRAPCRRRSGGAVLRAEFFGDLITADHKVLSESCESRNNHRYAIVVGLGHPMDPVVSVQNKNFSRNTKELAKVLGAK